MIIELVVKETKTKTATTTKKTKQKQVFFKNAPKETYRNQHRVDRVHFERI